METNIQIFLLIMTRMASFIWMSPGFSFRSMPQLGKLALTVGVSIAVYGILPMPAEMLTTSFFVLIAIKEILVGVAIGYITQLFFSGIEMAGTLVDFQVGFSMSMSLDPMMGIQSAFYGSIYYWILMVTYFATNMHHHLIRVLVNSYQQIPLTQIEFTYFGLDGIVYLFSYVFEIGLNLAFPLVIVALFSEVILALLSRTIPQINVLILGMPLKILVSIIFFFFFLPILFENIADVLPEMLKYLEQFIYSF